MAQAAAKKQKKRKASSAKRTTFSRTWNWKTVRFRNRVHGLAGATVATAHAAVAAHAEAADPALAGPSR